MLARATSTVRPAPAVVGLVLAAVLAGCGADEASGDGSATDAPEDRMRQVAAATLHPGDVVAPPSGRVVLVVTGGTTTNVGDELRLDVDQLDALGTVEYDVDDSLATGGTATFSGPLMRSVLELAGAEGGTTMHTEALNDYAVDVPVSDALDLPLMIATRMDGKRMSVAHYGPTRFVYPTEGYGLDPATYEPRWIWQLRSIEVE